MAPAPTAPAPTAPAPSSFLRLLRLRLRLLAPFYLNYYEIEWARKSMTLLQFVTFLIEHLCLTSGLELEPSEPERHRVGAPDSPK
jgi:hypothetical protein